MNALLTIFIILMCAVAAFVVPEYGLAAVAFCLFVALIAGLFIWRFDKSNEPLLRLFVGALAVRILVATAICFFEWQAFFGGDADTYDRYGYGLQQAWKGDAVYKNMVDNFTGAGGSGWGMLYLVAGIYEAIGRNPFAIQLLNTVIGAATAVLIFRIAHHIFDNQKVAWMAALFVAFYPSLVLWSAQGLKDAPIVFLLAVSMLATLKVGEKFSVKYFVLLVASVLGLLTLRFYIFYMVMAAIVGALAIGLRAFSAKSFARQFVVIILIGLSLTYVGVTRYAGKQLEAYGDLKMIQRSRSDAAQSAESGFGKDVDVSTTSGAIAAIPIGLAYLLFAPLPWQIASLRQIITLPEMVVWWASFPLMVLGLWFTIKYRLRQASPILLFSTLLTLGYSVFQGNVGTAYRQRSQLLVFYFIFVAVGFVLFKERRQDKKQQLEAEKDLVAAQRKGRAFAPFKTPRDFTVEPIFQASTPAAPGEER